MFMGGLPFSEDKGKRDGSGPEGEEGGCAGLYTLGPGSGMIRRDGPVPVGMAFFEVGVVLLGKVHLYGWGFQDSEPQSKSSESLSLLVA